MCATRREDYELVQEEMGLVSQARRMQMAFPSTGSFKNSRATERSEEVYFHRDLPKEQSPVTSNARYIRIRRQLESKDLVAQMHFVVSVGDIFNSFLMF